MFGWYQNCFYLCTRFSEVKYSGCSAVRLAHLLWEQGVVGSNPATPTKKNKLLIFNSLFLYIETSNKITVYNCLLRDQRKNLRAFLF